MNGFWASMLVFFASVNTLSAVLYAGVKALDDGGGFISFSPFVDCLLWGAIILVSGIVALVCWRTSRPSFPTVPRVFHYPIAYLATLAILSFAVLVMGMLQLLDRYNDSVHLPFIGYILFLVIAYPTFGYTTGRKLDGQWSDLLWGVLIATLLCGIGTVLIHQLNVEETPWQAQITAGTYFPSYTGHLMEMPLGGVLGRINLPACVLMDTYEYVYYENLEKVYYPTREVMTYLVCLCPPILFSVGWLVSVFSKRHAQK